MAASNVAWVPAQLTTDDYVVDLGFDGAREVKDAVKAFNDLGEDGDAIGAGNFKLPLVAERLRRASEEIYAGKGFCVVRGLDPKCLSTEDNLTAFLGIGSYVGGDLRGVQDKSGNVVVHVTDSKSWSVAPQKRHGIHTNGALPFHTDMGATVLALHVRQSALVGGDTYVVSAATIFNELMANHPDVVKILMEPQWPVQIVGSPPRHIVVPLMQQIDGKIMVSLDPGRLGVYDGHLAHCVNNRMRGGIPDISENQRRAFKIMSEVAQRHRLRLDIRVGDMLFINNWAVLHARDNYQDGDSSRHLVRLWLHDSKKGWAIPPALSAPWESAFGVGGDLKTSRAKGRRVYAVVPPVVYKAPRYAAGSAAFILEDEEEDS